MIKKLETPLATVTRKQLGNMPDDDRWNILRKAWQKAFQPPSLRRSAWLWVKIVVGFLIVNSVIINAICAASVRGLVPYEVVVPVYLVLTAPIALNSIANLATQLHVVRRPVVG